MDLSIKQAETNNYVVNSPSEMNKIFARAFNSGEIENLLSLYEVDAVLVNQNNQLLKGLTAISEELTNLLKLGGEMISENQYVVQNGDTALLRAKFVLKTKTPQGETFEIIGNTSEIIRQQTDGRWLYIIDHPFGADAQ